MSDFSRLGRVIADELGDGAQHVDLTQQKAGLITAVSQKRTVGWMPMVIGVTFACVMLLVGFLAWRTPDVTFEVNGAAGSEGQEVVSAADEVSVVFRDGSSVRLAAASRLVVENASAARVVVRLIAGRLDGHVQHGTPVKWDFLANGFDVHVVGTRLNVATTEPGGVTIGVTEGGVRVSGQGLPGAGVLVQRAHRFVTSGDGRYVIEDTDAATTEDRATNTENRIPTIDNRPPKVDERRPPSDVRKPEPRAAKPEVPSIDTLVAKADEARVAGDGPTARRALLALREHYPGSREAQRASFMLGRVAMELDHDAQAAARSFAGYIAANPQGELVEEAYGRELEALRAAADMATARQVAGTYLSRYPNGDYATLAHSLTGP